MKKAQTKKLSIPCFFIHTEKQKDESIKKKEVRFQSGRNSPTSPNQAKAKKITHAPKCYTRHHSPQQSISTRNSPPRCLAKPKVPSHIIKKKKSTKKVTKSEYKLTELDGRHIRYAPKIYENQIFADIYDELGHHDRIVEIQETLNSEAAGTPCIIYDNLENPSFEDSRPKPPGNSFLETSQDSYNILSAKGNCELFAKLELMAKEQNQ